LQAVKFESTEWVIEAFARDLEKIDAVFVHDTDAGENGFQNAAW